MSEYIKNITDCLLKIEDEEAEKLNEAAAEVARVIKDDGLIFVFGCGHSHLPGLDAFYRAGGLANVSPMLDTDLMLHNGAAKSSRMEKMSGIAPEIFRRYTLSKKDMIFVFSASGKNQLPIEMADCAREAGVKCVGVSSSSYFERGGKLHEHVDIAITIDGKRYTYNEVSAEKLAITIPYTPATDKVTIRFDRITEFAPVVYLVEVEEK